MSALVAIGGEAALCCVFGAIARERARALGFAASPTARTGLLAAIAFVPCLFAGHDPGRAIRVTILAACAAVSAATDLETGLIFDRVLTAAALPMIPAAIWDGGFVPGLGGAAAAGALLWLPHALSQGRAIGLGDVKLAAVVGFALGPAGALTALWAAAIGGGLVAAVLLAIRRARRDDTLPFGPFLAAGAAFAIVGAS